MLNTFLPSFDWTKIMHRLLKLDMTRAEAEEWIADHADPAYRAHVTAWLASRPAHIQRMHEKTPGYVFYRVMDHAPYRFTGPQSIVVIDSYGDDGTVRVVVVKRGTGESDLVRAKVAPQWLEQVTVEEAFPLAN
jgi:hypothetical protein